MALILVIEDDLSINALTKMNLELVGHRVAQAYDGEEAFRLAQAERPDLALVDILLPKRDG